ncbi:MAG: hypothetical protein WBA77_21545 [Microcoleaceae cyanobacterium]
MINRLPIKSIPVETATFETNKRKRHTGISTRKAIATHSGKNQPIG